jgi:anti-anti-sigma regulatory factor
MLNMNEIPQVLNHDVLLVSPDRSITYPAAEYVKDFVTKASLKAHGDLMIVVDGRAVHNIDSTAVKVFAQQDE